MIVLAWLQNPSCSWSAFVGNRVSEILENVGSENWSHVDSESNPADEASRGCSPDELKTHHLWWTGPSWLKLPRDHWPKHQLNCSELLDIKTRLIVVTQKHYFTEEYAALTQKKRLAPSSQLLPFNPFIDAKVTMHGGNQLTIRVIRSEFWIFRLKQSVKKVIHNCRTCALHQYKTQTQIMASLPPERTMLSRPFRNTVVDFAGPFGIKSITARACLITKGYVCIFVCFATREIHLEATSDLSTQSFIAALDRFIGRRGCPEKIFSDNGKNFVGAAELIKKDRIALDRFIGRRGCPEKIFSDNGKNFVGAAELIKKDRIAFMKSIQDTTVQ
ncbi:uncharacterized protein LOC142230887 [Haematobia irritans]|uniref:uncharacterized protein LOC142230887 n=1 Tax=Haematobia irritans TaxID=7368 RepID=UPI003F5004E1